MMDSTKIIADTAAERRQVAAVAEHRRDETWRNEAPGLQATWNSWGERSPFAMGATGRW